MTRHKPSVFRSIELDLIKKDIYFYCELMLKLQNKKPAGVFFPSLIPYFSLFTIETYKYFQRFYPQYENPLSDRFQAIIKSSRMRTKFFDDTQKKVDGTFELLDWISDFHYEWHINAHKGLLSPIKRALQDDLGIFFYYGHVIGSTHTGILNLGYSKGDLPATSDQISSFVGPLSHSLGQELGEYIRKIISFPEFISNSEPAYFTYNIQDKMLGYKDEKSEKYLNSIFNGVTSKAINLSLILFLAQVNFLQYVLNNLAIESPYTLFKLKYVVLYHLASSLRKLQNYCHKKQMLTEYSKKHLQAIIKDKDLKQIMSQSKFRNILVHYTIEGLSDEVISPTIEFYGLVEYFFDGRTYDEITGVVDGQMKRVSMILEDWLNWQVKQSQIRSW